VGWKNKWETTTCKRLCLGMLLPVGGATTEFGKRYSCPYQVTRLDIDENAWW